MKRRKKKKEGVRRDRGGGGAEKWIEERKKRALSEGEEGGNLRGEQQGFPDLLFIFLRFFPPLFIPRLLSSFTLFSHSHALCWITHAYLTLQHLQKQWTYSLAFRVLMKAPRVEAPSLFPYTSSSPNPTSPAASYTIYSTSTPKTWLSHSALSASCSLFLQKFNYRGTDLYDLKQRNVWEMWKSPIGFSFSSSSTTFTQGCSIHAPHFSFIHPFI